MSDPLELLALTEGAACKLSSPGVGTFSCALPKGQAIVPGQVLGVLTTLGRSVELLAPAGVSGQIVSELPERVCHPVGYGDTLYEIEALESGALEPTIEAPEESPDGLVLRATQSGRFWRRPGPNQPASASEGDELRSGSSVGLIEVMKTFTSVTYVPKGTLPPTARVVRFVVEDGDEVAEGDPLVVVEEL